MACSVRMPAARFCWRLLLLLVLVVVMIGCVGGGRSRERCVFETGGVVGVALPPSSCRLSVLSLKYKKRSRDRTPGEKRSLRRYSSEPSPLGRWEGMSIARAGGGVFRGLWAVFSLSLSLSSGEIVSRDVVVVSLGIAR